MTRRASSAEIGRYLVELVAESVGRSADSIDPNTPLREYGIDSTLAVFITGKVEEWLGIEIDPALAWEHPTISALAAQIELLAPGKAS